KEHEYLGTPVAEAPELHDRREGLIVGEVGETTGRESPLQDRVCEAARIADLLPCEAAVHERRLVELEEAARRQRAAALLEPAPKLCRDIERQLLLQDDVQERTEARRPARETRQAVGREDAGEVGIEPGQRSGTSLEPIGGVSGRARGCAPAFQ